MKPSKLIFLTILATLTGARALQAGTNKAAGSSALATAPTYDQTGVLESGSYGDTAKFTDAHGNTSSVTCVGSDCAEAIGLSEWATLPDKTRLYFSPIDPGVDLDHWEGHGEFVTYATVADHLDNLTGQTMSFRFRTAAVVVNIPSPIKARFFCVPLKIDLNGKTREAYAKHHSMEACNKVLG